MGKKSDSMDGSKTVEPTEVPWSDAVVLICTKCAKKISSRDGEDLSDSLKKAFKTQVKHGDMQGKIRTLTSSCLDICPKDRVAIAIATKDAPGVFEAITMHKNADVERTASEVIEKIKARSKE